MARLRDEMLCTAMEKEEGLSSLQGKTPKTL